MQSHGLELSEGRAGGRRELIFFLAFHFNNSNLRAVKITHAKNNVEITPVYNKVVKIRQFDHSFMTVLPLIGFSHDSNGVKRMNILGS